MTLRPTDTRASIVRVLVAAALCGELALSAPVAAQSTSDLGVRAAARDLAVQGVQAYLAGDYPLASETLEKAYSLFPTPTLGLWSARASVNRGFWIEAAERYREALRLETNVGDSAMQQSAHEDAATELASLVERLPAVTFQLLGASAAGVTLSLDGTEVPIALVGVRRPINPGRHIVAAVRGSERGEMSFQIGENEQKVVELRLVSSSTRGIPPPRSQPAAARPPVAERIHKTRAEPSSTDLDKARGANGARVRPLAIAAIALGGAGILASGLTAIVAQGKCSGGRCANESDQAAYDPLRTLSSVTFWAGTGLAASGALLWLLAPQPQNKTSDSGVSWMLGPFGVSVSGTL
jgi:hypothetical protein